MPFYKKTALWLLCCFLVIDCNEPQSKKEQQPGFISSVQAHNLPGNTNDKKDSLKSDTTLYNALLLHLVHNNPSAKWPVKAGYPLPGAILPFKRIVAYYGNFYSPEMGILGKSPPYEMLRQLAAEVKKWQAADTSIPVLPALQYIVVTAQRKPGEGGKYRLRMPFSQVDMVMALAEKINAIVILDVQAGQSTLEEELPPLEQYLRLPNVHLAIDAEYSMKRGEVPCTVIGTFDAADINYASGYLAGLVRRYNLPPKILVVHRFTKEMLTNYKKITLRPEVQIVVNMDGFGFPAKKINSYKIAVADEPVQFAGFKLFYKQDLTPPWKTLMQPQEVLKLYPSPVYIQYQ